MFRANLANLTTGAGAINTVNFRWTINGGILVAGAAQESPWDCATALYYNRRLTVTEYKAVEWWLNEVGRPGFERACMGAPSAPRYLAAWACRS
jgi:hypothetical protein